MKKLFTITLMLLLVVGLNAQKKQLAYVTKPIEEAKLVEGAASVDYDAILEILYDDDNFSIDYFECDAAGIEVGGTDPVDLSSYDVIIAQERFGSGDAVWKTGGIFDLSALPAPILYNKMFAFRKNLALPSTSPGASVDARGIKEMEVAEGQEDNEIFIGIELDSLNRFAVLIDSTSDYGCTVGDCAGYKLMQYNTGNVISEAGTMIAFPAGCGDKAVIAINDFPAGTDIDGVVLGERVITMNFNYGTLIANDGQNLTEAGKLLWKNAIYSLAGLEIKIKNIEKNTLENFNIKYSGNQLMIDFDQVQNAQISIYNIAGKIVDQKNVFGTNALFDVSGQSKGIYIIKIEGERINGAQKIVLN